MTETTVKLGPLAFVTVDGGLAEPLGNPVEVIAGAIAAADPKPREFGLVLPVRPLAEFDDALRLRRQVRALLNNAGVRMRGLYFSWDIDPELNAWLIVGGGDLEPAEGGITMADFKLTLKDCYVVGRRRTHRPALQAQVADRRLSTTPRDVLRRIYGTDFASMATVAKVALPAGIDDLVTFGTLPTLETVTTQDGDIANASGVVDGQVLSFEQPEALAALAEVQVWDQQGSVVEADWEAVYGADQPLTAGDVPVIENGVCRLRPVNLATSTLAALALETYSAGAWVERGRVTIGTLVSARVVEWSPERAVISVVSLIAGVRVLTFVTVQRGWDGPMIERYGTGTVPLRYVSNATGGPTFYRQPTTGNAVVAVGTPVPAGTVTTFLGQNWIELAANGLSDVLAVLLAATTAVRGSDSVVYRAARSYVELQAPGYVAARFGLANRLPVAVNGGPFVYDDFSASTIGNYTVTGTGLSITGGLLTVSSTASKVLLHTASAGIDGAAVLKVNVGASVTTWSLRTILRGTDDANYLAAQLDNTGALVILKRVANVDTTLATFPGANISTRVTRWLVLRANGAALTAEWWDSDPTAGGIPSRTCAWTLSAGDLALFPAGSGKGGARLVPGGTDWTYDDFLILPAAGEPQKHGQETLTDARAVPVLVART